jgi:hypothetical protein
MVFGTIAFMTRNSARAAGPHRRRPPVLPGDLAWDAGRSVAWSHGTDLMFWVNALQVIVFGILAMFALAD